MERVEIVCLKSVILCSITDLEGPWNANDYQKKRTDETRDVIEACLISQTSRVEYNGVDLVKVYQKACDRLNKDPYGFAKRAIDLTERVQQRDSTIEDRKTLVAFCNVLVGCFNQVLGR